MADIYYQAIQQQNTGCQLILESPQCSTGFTPDCVTTFCKGSVLGACNVDCCESADPAACLSSAPATDTNQQGCETAHSIIAACTSLTSSFFSLPATQQVPCLCYSSGDYRPDILDEAADRCYSYLSTQNPPSATVFSAGVVGFCTDHVLTTSTTTISSQSTASVTSSQVSSTDSSVPPVTSASTSAPVNTSPAASNNAKQKRSSGFAIYLLVPVLPLLLECLGRL